MPAPLGPCIICSSSSSKYKCPSCQAPTCSLPCHKEHKASNHTASSSASGSSSSNARPSAPAGPSTSALTASATSWVPMRSYDSSQFLKDYHFLSQIGRHVSAAGKELVSQGWMPPTAAPQQQHDNGKRPPGPAGGSVDPQKWQARKQREALEEAVRGRRCKVLWLPEGMGRREENRTSCAGGNNNRRGGGGGGGGVRWSLELAWGCGDGKEKKRQILHDVAGGMPVEVKVMAELQRESFKAAPKGWKREVNETSAHNGETTQQQQPQQQQPQQQGLPAEPAGGASSSAKKRARRRGAAKAREGGHISVNGEAGKEGADASNGGPSTSTPAAPAHHAQHPTEYLISDHVLSTYGLLSPPPPPSSSTPTPPSPIPQPYTHLPPHIALAVQVHPTRLRNESSAKFYEWWERRGKAQQAEEEAEERAAKALAAEAVAQQEDAARAAAAAHGAYGGYGRGASPPSAPRAMLQQQMGGGQGYANPLVAPAAAAAPTSLLSAGLLAQLSAKLNAANAMQAKQSPTAASPPPPAQGNAKTTQEVAAPNGEQQQQANGHDAKVASPSAPAAKSRPPVRLLYPLPSSSGHPPISQADSSSSSPPPVAPPHSSSPPLTLEGMLRSLPRGHSIVEFARVEVWRREELQRYVEKAKMKDEREDGEEEQSGVKVVLWEEEGEGGPESTAPAAKAGSAELASAAAQSGATAGPSSTSPAAPAAVTTTINNPPSRPVAPAAPAPKPASLAGLLSGYASDSDEDEEEEEEEEPPDSQGNADEQPGLAVNGGNGTIRSDEIGHTGPLLSQYDDEEEDDEDEEFDEGEESGGLAAMARRLGWARAPPAPAGPSTVSSAPEDAAAAAAAAAAVVPKRRKRRKHMPVVEEEQLDWGDE